MTTAELGELLRQAVNHANKYHSIATSDPWWFTAASWLEPRLKPGPQNIEAAARALWKMGNARIGVRPWESVAAHYIAEAMVALEAADATRGANDR